MTTESGMSWGVRTSFVDYIVRSQGRITKTEPAYGAEAMFSWPAMPGETWMLDSTDSGVLRCLGSVVFEAHFGALHIELRDPELTVRRGVGQLLVTVGDHRVPIVELTVTSAPAAEGYVAWVADQVKLTEQGSLLFGMNYPVGAPMEPMIFVSAIGSG